MLTVKERFISNHTILDQCLVISIYHLLVLIMDECHEHILYEVSLSILIVHDTVFVANIESISFNSILLSEDLKARIFFDSCD